MDEQSARSRIPGSTGDRQPGFLGARLRGVHHAGITVQNMDRAFEFYSQVLGGTEIMRDSGLHGDALHNTLLMHEEIGAHEAGVNPYTVSVPDLRGGSQRLDMRLIQLGNLVVELLRYHDQNESQEPRNSFAPPHGRTSPAFPGTAHICFCVYDDVDLNQFISDLETEAQRRGMTNVRANRTAACVTEQARIEAPPYSYSMKSSSGLLEGLAVMYCKGPEGEQLEFAQVLGRAKETFQSSYQDRQREL